MFQRENIYEIIEKTMPFYYKKVFGKDVSVHIKKGSFFKKLLIYPRLGIIIPLFPSKKVRREVYSWFNVQHNWIKNVLAKLYIFICFITFGIFASASMTLSDNTLYNKNTLIIPSNRKIRIYYFDKKYVDSVVKNGFNDQYFKNEVFVRERYKYPFILGFLDKGDKWYREKILIGKGLVRVSSPHYEKYLNDTLANLQILYRDNKKTIIAKDYFIQLTRSINSNLSIVKEKKSIQCEKRLKEIIDYCSRYLKDSNELIDLVLSHGDLQSGNIHIDEENKMAYIIDWETANYKSIWYDSGTLLCSTRRKGKFFKMINSRFEVETKNRLLFFDSNKCRDMNIVVSVLLLEELSFYLDEMAGFPDNIGSEVIDRFIYEINNVNWESFK